MEVLKKIAAMPKEKKITAAMVTFGIIGMLLIMISSFLPEEKSRSSADMRQAADMSEAESYQDAVQTRLEEFLGSIDGAGRVKVYITVGSQQRYVYATEGRRNITDNKTEEEEKYVIVGSGSEKEALVETVEVPEIRGAVIACTGGGSAAVREQIYRAASAALGIPTGKIYVTSLKGE